MIEKWKDIPNYEGLYQASTFGRIKSKNGILKPKVKSDGYYRVTLCKNKKQKTLYIHRLIAETFLDNPNNLPEVNHIDENKHNNNINNLEWCSHEYNMKYGSHKDCLFQKNHKHYPRRQKHIKLTLQEIEEIKKLIEENKSKYDIAVLYNVSYGTIYRIGKVND